MGPAARKMASARGECINPLARSAVSIEENALGVEEELDPLIEPVGAAVDDEGDRPHGRDIGGRRDVVEVDGYPLPALALHATAPPEPRGSIAREPEIGGKKLRIRGQIHTDVGAVH